MTTPPISLLNHHLLLRPIHKQQPERRHGKKDTVHNPKRKCRFQHRALLIDIKTEWTVSIKSVRPKRDVKGAIGAEVRAVSIGNAAQVVDARDQGADEADVDKADEVGGAPCGFAAEEGEEAPYGGEGGDYEEDSKQTLSGRPGYELKKIAWEAYRT